MTTEGSPQLGAKGQVRLRKFIWNATKDVSATDTSQTPAASATVTVYKQGATAQSGGSDSGGTGTIEVWSPGQIKVGDILLAATNDPTGASPCTVTAVTTTQITFGSGAGFTWSDDERMIITNNQPVLYTDDHAEDATALNTVTLGDRGDGEIYTEPNVVDYKLSGTGLTTKYFADYYAASHDSEIRQIEHFPGADFGSKLANALNDLNETTGGIVDARGMIGSQTISSGTSGDPFASVTWPFTLLLGPCTITTDVALADCFSEDGQHVVGAGEGITTVTASGALAYVFSLGDGTATKDCSLRNLTVDCGATPANIGVRYNGAQAGCRIDNVHVKNAKVSSLAFVGVTGPTDADTTYYARATNVVLETNSGTASSITADANVGEGCAVENAHLVANAAAVNGVDKQNTTSLRLSNITGTGYANLIHIKAEGGCVVDRAVGDTTCTTVVLVATSVTEFNLRTIILNSATNSVVDTDQSITITESIEHYTGGVSILDDLRVKGDFNIGASNIGTATLVSGAFTPTKGFHTVEGEGGSADTLDTITATNAVVGDIVIIKKGGEIITLSATADNLKLRGNVDLILQNSHDIAAFMWDGTNWHELFRNIVGIFQNWGKATPVTVSGASPWTITPTAFYHTVTGYTALDVLETIAGTFTDGDLLLIKPDSTIGELVLGAGGNININTSGARLASDNDHGFLIYDAITSKWNQMFAVQA